MIHSLQGYIAAISIKGNGTWHAFRFMKGQKPFGEIDNTFGGGGFFTPASHARNLNRGNFNSCRVLVVPPNGSWYFIAARDDEEEFEERSQSLKIMWMHLKANLSNFKSIEEPETTVLECEFVEDEISHELFQELTFTHYNTIKSS